MHRVQSSSAGIGQNHTFLNEGLNTNFALTRIKEKKSLISLCCCQIIPFHSIICLLYLELCQSHLIASLQSREGCRDFSADFQIGICNEHRQSATLEFSQLSSLILLRYCTATTRSRARAWKRDFTILTVSKNTFRNIVIASYFTTVV